MPLSLKLFLGAMGTIAVTCLVLGFFIIIQGMQHSCR